VALEFSGSFGGRAGPIRGSPWRVAVEEGSDPAYACATVASFGGGHNRRCARACSVNRFDGPLMTETVKRNIHSLQTLCTSTLAGLTRQVQARAGPWRRALGAA
jgi:hypothetical protein